MKESVIWSGRPSWRGYVYPLGFSAFWMLVGILIVCLSSSEENVGRSWIGLAMMLASVYSAVTAVYDRFQAFYRITTARLICKYGILTTRSIELDLQDIRTINVTQNLMQKVLNLGDMEFATASGSAKDAYLRNIEDPEKLKEAIHALKSTHPASNEQE